jgi:crotonobetaine/carnitine-CoA ligase
MASGGDDKRTWTIVDLVRRQAARHGPREFMAFEDGHRLTFAGLDADTDRLARVLAALGAGPGDRVLALLRNRAELMLAMVATQKLGAIFVPINTELKGAFLEHQLRNAQPVVAFVETALAGAFDGVDPGDAALRAVVFVAGGVPGRIPAALAAGRALAFEALTGLASAAADVLVTPAPHDVACIMYTSGTTGPAKGVLMPHAHCYLFGLGTVRALGLTERDRYYVCMPLFHANALMMQVLGSLIAGAWVHCAERFSPGRWLDDLRASGATVTNGLGVMPEFIFRTPPTPHDRDHAVRLMMAVPVSAEWGEAFERRFGLTIVQGFGMTECNIPCYTAPGDPLVPGCAGRVLDDYFELRVVDPATDEPLPPDAVGEIVVRPREPGCFMAGYFRMPERTVEAWRNLWFHTGDAGRLDGQGRLHFVDRIKDCIRRRGENISAFEVEQVLNRHPAVAESAVVGVKVAGAGGEEEVKACIVTRPGREVDPVALLDHCVARMPRYAVPRFVELVDALPKTATGKLQKQGLREAGVTDRTWDREASGYTIARR